MNLCVALGAALSTAILVGALATGDSVRGSLMRRVQQRLGHVEYALTAMDRTCRAALADAIAERTAFEVVAVYRAGGSVQLQPVSVLGIDQRFWTLGSSGGRGAPGVPADGEAMVCQRLADRLHLAVGDSILLRVDKPSLLPGELSLASVRMATLGLRVTVSAIVTPDQFGAFQMQQEATPTYNVFVSRTWLTAESGLEDRANLLLAGGAASGTEEDLNQALRAVWTAADASLLFEVLSDNRGVELRSQRVFIDPPVADVALKLNAGATPVLTYLVNSICYGERCIPYSFVSAPGDAKLPAVSGPHSIFLNAWAQNDLEVKPGDRVSLTYYVPGPMRQLVEQTNTFEVAGILPMSADVCDRGLVPSLPGISDAETCADWDPGIAIDLARIRPADESYWKTYHGTPKAFLPLSSATALWQNRYGSYTAIRFPGTNTTALANVLMERLDPAQLGLSFAPVKKAADEASGGSVDFGQLFLSLSFFILFSALLLTGLLFVFSVRSRAAEMGTLLCLGWEKWSVRSLFLGEGVLIAVAGGTIGLLPGIVYHHLVLRALETIWHGAVGTSDLVSAIRPVSVLQGWLSGITVSVLVMLLALRRLSAETPARLIAEPVPKGRRRGPLAVSMLSGLSALGVLVLVDAHRGQQVASVFFGAGSLLLLSLLAMFAALLAPGVRSLAAGASFGKVGLMLRGCRRRRGRTLASVALLASGIFVVVAVSANRHSISVNPENRHSGTGGFAFFMQSLLPVVHDLNTAKGRKGAGLDATFPTSVRFVSCRLLEGDEASCLNLNKVLQPQVLGVDTAALDQRGAFSFTHLPAGAEADAPWQALEKEIDDSTIPAVADQTVITWSLNKALGDNLLIRDEHGRELRLKLVGGLQNSILQGYVMVSEKLLLKHFPSLKGCRVFWVDAPVQGRDVVEAQLRSVFGNYGMLLMSASDRLESFSVVQNTYLSIFLLLGGLGVVLGTAGVGVVLLRNVLERRRELAILRATGFTRGEVTRYIMGEHALIVCGGVFCGVPSALLAVLPSMTASGQVIPWLQLHMIITLIITSAFVWIYVATRLAVRGSLLDALR